MFCFFYHECSCFYVDYAYYDCFQWWLRITWLPFSLNNKICYYHQARSFFCRLAICRNWSKRHAFRRSFEHSGPASSQLRASFEWKYRVSSKPGQLRASFEQVSNENCEFRVKIVNFEWTGPASSQLRASFEPASSRYTEFFVVRASVEPASSKRLAN